MKDKIGLVLGGGGSRGAYQVGALIALKELGYHFDIVTGTSVGALNGAMWVQDILPQLKEEWFNLTYENVMDLKKSDCINKNRNNEVFFNAVINQGNSISPLKKMVKKYLKEDKIRKSQVKYGCVSTKMFGLKKMEMSVDEMPKNKLCDFILASLSCFPFFKPHEIDGELYIDGFYRDNLPKHLAYLMGATKLLCIKISQGISIPIPKHIQTITIAPGGNLRFALEFTIDNIKQLYFRGYNDIYTLHNSGALNFDDI